MAVLGDPKCGSSLFTDLCVRTGNKFKKGNLPIWIKVLQCLQSCSWTNKYADNIPIHNIYSHFYWNLCFSSPNWHWFWFSQLLQRTESMGTFDRIRPVQRSHKSLLGPGVRVEGLQLDCHEGGSGAGERGRLSLLFSVFVWLLAFLSSRSHGSFRTRWAALWKLSSDVPAQLGGLAVGTRHCGRRAWLSFLSLYKAVLCKECSQDRWRTWCVVTRHWTETNACHRSVCQQGTQRDLKWDPCMCMGLLKITQYWGGTVFVINTFTGTNFLFVKRTKVRKYICYHLPVCGKCNYASECKRTKGRGLCCSSIAFFFSW